MIERVGKGDVDLARAARTAMQRCAERGRHAAGHPFARAVEGNHNGGQSHGSAPFVIRIMEK